MPGVCGWDRAVRAIPGKRARRSGLPARTTRSGRRHELWFDWRRVASSAAEEKISGSVLEIDGAHLDFALLIAALERERQLLADADVVEHRDEIGERLRRLAVERDDDVADAPAPQV